MSRLTGMKILTTAPFIRRTIPALLALFLLSLSTGCVSNLWKCPEDTFKREECPTEARKEMHDFYVILLVLMNNGNIPPGLIK